MSVLGWMTAVGVLLLFMALTSAQVQRLPISTSIIYLVVGVALGPVGFGVMQVDLERQRHGLEVLTQVAVIVSLFVGGLKLRLPLAHRSWRIAFRLAGPVMLASIVGMTLIANLVLGVPPFLALLIGAALAPTDPVLASAVSVNDAEDHDRVRFALSGEAGLNDGMAFPFVILALEGMRESAVGGWLLHWALARVLWAVPVALLVGWVLGLWVGRFAIFMRSRQRDTAAPSDFLALALIALAFVSAEWLHGYGFLAVFAAGVGLRHAELRVVAESPHPDALGKLTGWFGHERASSPRSPLSPLSPLSPVSSATAAVAHPPAETLVPTSVSEEEIEQPAVAAGVLISEALSFGDTVERLLEVMLVVLVGVALAHVWTPSALVIAAILLLVLRPLSTMFMLRGTTASRAQRRLLGWFGIRGIGSLYYVAYALNHGVSGADATLLVGVVVTVVACSITVHGISVTPILTRYERSLRRHVQ